MTKNIEHIKDVVYNPTHYLPSGEGNMECIDAIRASIPIRSFRDFCKANVIKYIWRFDSKGGIEDLKKAKVYLDWMIETQEKIDERDKLKGETYD